MSIDLQKLKFDNRADAENARIPIQGCPKLFMTPVGGWILDDHQLVQSMTDWRTSNREMYFSRFEETPDSMRRYLLDISINEHSTLLFIIEDSDGNVFGHIGVKNVNEIDAEIDSVVRATEVTSPLLMDRALKTLIAYCEYCLGIYSFSLEVISYNDKALNLYTRNGFNVSEFFPLYRSVEGANVEHKKVKASEANVDYHSLKLTRNSTEKGRPRQ